MTLSYHVFSLSRLASFIALSHPNLQQVPNVTPQILLAHISQQLSNADAGLVVFAFRGNHIVAALPTEAYSCLSTLTITLPSA